MASFVRRSIRLSTDDIESKAVSRPKMTFFSQVGSAKPGTVAYGTPFKAGEPSVVLEPLNAGVTASNVKRVATASFDFAGASGSYYLYSAAGSA